MFGSSVAPLFMVVLSLTSLGLAGLTLILWYRLSRASQAKLGSDSRYYTVIEQAGDGIFLVDGQTGLLVEANSSLRRRLGYRSEEIVTLRVENVLIENDTSMDTHASLMHAYTRSSARSLKERCKDGRLLDVEVAVTTLELEGRRTLCYISHDVTERRRVERELLRNQQRLDYIAHHDSLTGLPNRLRLLTYLEDLLASSESGPGFAVMLLDLNDFKLTNDSLGHHVGDQLLVGVAKRLKEFVARGDLVARLGGDEFVVVRSGPHDTRSTLASAREIATLLGGELSIGEHTIVPSVSVGITLCPDQGTNLETVMRNADLAMYAAKRGDQGSVRVFESAMTQFMERNTVSRTRSGRQNR
jgi:diguanylate cyclase (GGDEF)-like protein/PAS domain S-box-containing protein